LNWEKFNPRRDVTKPSWFRLSHDLFENPEFFDFSHADLVSWIYILSMASKKNSAVIQVNMQHVERIGRVKAKDFHVAIEKLKFIQCVHVDYTDTLRGRYADDTPTNATNERDERNETNEHMPDSAAAEPRRAFDFDALYKKYPRKDGKTKGIAVCRTQVKSPEDFAALSMAIDRYGEHCKRTISDPKYIKHFSTFMNSWRDWLEADTGTAPKPLEAEPEWVRRAKAEEERKNAV
jgi:hypothetical protein